MKLDVLLTDGDYKNPNEDRFNDYKEEVVTILKNNEISVLMPVGNGSNKFAS